MKAKIKATGEIVEVDECGQAFKNMRMDYMDMRGRCYSSEDLDFTDNTPFDYWTRLEHQYAGMAMQGLLNNNLLSSVLFKTGTTHEDYINEVVKVTKEYAHALVGKMKNKEE